MTNVPDHDRTTPPSVDEAIAAQLRGNLRAPSSKSNTRVKITFTRDDWKIIQKLAHAHGVSASHFVSASMKVLLHQYSLTTAAGEEPAR